MSVFTPLARPELEAFLAPYGLGRLLDYQGIAAGSENTNYFISLEQGEFVLTLVERGPVQEMPFFIELLDVLHDANLPVPYALRTTDGQALRELAGKPALLQPRLPGKHISEPNTQHCVQIGELLANLHLATREQVLERKTDRGLDWMLSEGRNFLSHLGEAQRALLEKNLQEIEDLKPQIMALPRANLHADLFRDNVLFEGTHLTGLIDFYNACSGPMLYDLAIALNDWCSRENGQLDAVRARALLGAYAGLRPFTAAESKLWATMLRIACVRFWLSRLIAAEIFAGQDVLIHDPVEFEQRLAERQTPHIALPFAL
ncbi:homoserine kinase [Pseudomonas syringae]|uniref:Homoserine kinase n=1 Tax=Pseudomonas syringae pv. actinidiae TaxID=103796 RepID=A0A2V0QTD8_PSESF|nr:homoserine kinase [Pseudomonas syringae]AQL40265.1 homoserine kinase [Pseudomonas syringae pv. actinidiae ICMP 9853]EGH65898.1 homoserine kinase [Pseudomonas syringae pv. actinidiae str. M302091]EPM46571.1 homoserine kinase [Pseudomonas syringae pv. actinidiae ICMP 19103]EPM48179.1 homoserine kinase [Pseudomonas syringae pv. actinidiae ICMP 19073]EPM62371.1 homoserine kinase [Pseudomonas syringae pv. actinidiae ICMP 19071]